MKALSLRETLLLVAALALISVAWFAPSLAQPAYYHQFADQRAWLGAPCALDVSSNLPFALFGAWGLRVLRRVPAHALDETARRLAALFFIGLVLSALGSAWYHWGPDDAGLVIDRLAMVLAFAGLLGLGAAGHVGTRAGNALAATVLLLGPLSVWVWAANGNLLPWAVLQGAGMALLIVLAFARPMPGALPVLWGMVVALYALAKALELTDHAVYAFSGQLVSGHSLKHVAAALAAWPVIGALRSLGQNADQG